MATSKKKSFYIPLGTAAFMELSLDPDIYDADTLTATGISGAARASGDGVVPVTVKQAARSNKALLLKLTCYQGADLDSATDTRVVEILCAQASADTVKSALLDKTIVLGIGTTAKSWKIGRVR